MPADAPMPESLGTRLRRVREGEKLSASTVASMLDVPSAAIEEIESGQRTSGQEVDRVREWLDTSTRDQPET